MEKLLRLALALFMWFNVLYADENNLKLTEVREYKYNPKGELSDMYIYDSDEILRTRKSYYYDKGRLIKHYNFTNGQDGRLFVYEYSDGKLIKMYEAEWTTLKPVKSAEGLMIEYEYNKYGNLVYRYEYTINVIDKVFMGKIVPTVYKTKYEYENGIVWVTLFQDDVPLVKTKCVYDSEQKLVGAKMYKEYILAFEIKYHYDGNRLSYSTFAGLNFDAVKGKTKYEYDSSGKLIRESRYGNQLPQQCTPNDVIFR